MARGLGGQFTMKPVQVFADYFGAGTLGAGYGNPVIAQEYRRATGWKRTQWRKRCSMSWARKLARDGVEWIAVEGPSGRVVDFRIVEVLRSKVIG